MQSFVGVGVNIPYKYRVAFEILLEMLATSITPDCKYGAFKPKRKLFPLDLIPQEDRDAQLESYN